MSSSWTASGLYGVCPRDFPENILISSFTNGTPRRRWISSRWIYQDELIIVWKNLPKRTLRLLVLGTTTFTKLKSGLIYISNTSFYNEARKFKRNLNSCLATVSPPFKGDNNGNEFHWSFFLNKHAALLFALVKANSRIQCRKAQAQWTVNTCQ